MSDASPAALERAPLPSSGEGTATRTTRGLALLAAALLLGAAGHLLVGFPPGIGFPLWLAAILATATLLSRRLAIALRGEGRWLFLPALLFAAVIAWRSSPALLVLNLLGVLLCLALGAWWARSGRPRESGIGEYVRGLLHGAKHVAVGPVLLGVGDIRWGEVTTRGRSERAAVLLRGLLLASPLLFLFGALFVSADPVFDRLLRDLFGAGWERALEAVARTALGAWLAAGFLRATLLSRAAASPPAATREERGWSLDPLEAVVVLTLLGSLFLAFVLVQFRYLFGGAELVQEVAGMSFAEYARRGFFELVAVAALLLPVLLALDALTAREGGERPRALRALSLGVVALMLVIIASAAERMRLYQAAYGLTEQRVYASAFMAWLAVVFVWFAVTALRGRRERFPWGALLAGLATLAALDLLDPDALIARVNVERAERAERLDTGYLGQLSADAAPVLLGAIDDLPEERACVLAVSLLERMGPDPRAEGWTRWNRSRARAARLVREREAELRAIACYPEPPPPGRGRPAGAVLPGAPPPR